LLCVLPWLSPATKAKVVVSSLHHYSHQRNSTLHLYQYVTRQSQYVSTSLSFLSSMYNW
jgi:hypothetical protein